ncbi:amidase family protein [Robertkochia sediminum]|uniref:amidase family protein n=1 Tax=Robertkochia sediminum TaxID=2785326 RepID=UPI0019345B01|nr:amidase family protein [Robertkochia sediminum]MBL7472705.1 amidase [Robertkochia sediminum]
MRTTLLTIFLLALVSSCKQEPQQEAVAVAYDEAALIDAQQDHENPRMRFKLISSRVEREYMFAPFSAALKAFGEERYHEMKPLVLEKNIPELQEAVANNAFTYKDLCLFYIWRMREYESRPETALNTIIAINPVILQQAEEADKIRIKGQEELHPVFGMPILLKDNIGTSEMPTTAGAVALLDNRADDAFITKKLKEHGALILGKANLSEWAYYFCQGCPVGYSAIGGQTLNPYGPRQFETGGSSSGSGVAIAANYAVAAVGTETAGSILSPSGQNSVTGLKPTVGVLGRTGIVPISGTLDTPGPMTRSIVDNAILMDAMFGEDPDDAASMKREMSFMDGLDSLSLKGMRLGVYEPFVNSDSLYAQTVGRLKRAGVEIVVFEEQEGNGLNGFLTLLNIDMKYDLPVYLNTQASKNITVRGVADVVDFNLADSLVRMPYGQGLFEGILKDSTTTDEVQAIKDRLRIAGQEFFDPALKEAGVDAFLSINNYSAAYAALAKYPALCMPMGYRESGEPVGLTLIGLPYTEPELLQLGYAVEKELQARKIPKNYN